MTLRKETSPIVYRSFKVREAAYEEFLRRERTAERRKITIAAFVLLVLFALFMEGLR
jgi:hypothetical protein